MVKTALKERLVPLVKMGREDKMVWMENKDLLDHKDVKVIKVRLESLVHLVHKVKEENRECTASKENKASEVKSDLWDHRAIKVMPVWISRVTKVMQVNLVKMEKLCQSKEKRETKEYEEKRECEENLDLSDLNLILKKGQLDQKVNQVFQDFLVAQERLACPDFQVEMDKMAY